MAAVSSSSVIPRWLLESNLTADLDEDDVAALINDVNNGGGGRGSGDAASNISAGEILDSLFFDSEDVYGGAGIGITPLDSGGGVMNVSSSAAAETEEFKMFEFVTSGVLLMAVSLFGLAGNVVSIIVLSRPQMKGSFSTLLIGLSSFDLLYLVVAIMIFGLPSISENYKNSIYVEILPVSYGFGHIGRVGSVFVTMSVTIERYFAIVHPLKHFSAKKFLLLASVVAALLYNVPKFYEFEKKVVALENGTQVTTVDGTGLRSNQKYITYYIFWSKFLLVEMIPYITIIVLNSMILGKIWKSTQFRKRFVSMGENSDPDPEMTSRQRREANLGVVLISISVLFIACQSVKIIPDVYEVSCHLSAAIKGEGDECPSNAIIDHLIDMSHLLLAINSSANFVIYTWRGEKFREVLTMTFCCRKPDPVMTTRYETTTTTTTIAHNHCGPPSASSASSGRALTAFGSEAAAAAALQDQEDSTTEDAALLTDRSPETAVEACNSFQLKELQRPPTRASSGDDSEPCCILPQNGEGHSAAKATSVVTKKKILGSATFV